jgi:phosphate starvation-inducible protein PhoH
MSNYRNKQQGNSRPEGALHTITLDSPSDKTLASILYRQDRGHLHQYFGQKFGVQFDVNYNPDKVAFYGSDENAARVKKAFDMLSGQVESRAHIDKDAISKIAAQLNPNAGLSAATPAAAAFKAANQNKPSSAAAKHEGGSSGSAFQALNPAQENLAKLIAENDLIFALGPAGTGKTHVAVVKGIEALKNGDVKKLLLARPAAEAGEKIGYLPGDANAKLAPYMRPIYDELDKAFGPGKYKGMMETGVIEIVPIGYMRGRTFDEAFIIVDESQNLTREQTKMAITRIGKGSKMVMTGDPQQIDLRDKNDSGLIWASQIMEGKKGAATQTFEQTHVVRSEIVMAFVAAVDEFEGLDKPKFDAPGASPAPAKAQPNQPSTPGKW